MPQERSVAGSIQLTLRMLFDASKFEVPMRNRLELVDATLSMDIAIIATRGQGNDITFLSDNDTAGTPAR